MQNQYGVNGGVRQPTEEMAAGATTVPRTHLTAERASAGVTSRATEEPRPPHPPVLPIQGKAKAQSGQPRPSRELPLL